MSRLFLALRHGERADRAATQRLVPLQFDPCLTEKGLLQASQSAAHILSLLPQPCTVHLVSSPFLRCLETASFLSKALSTPIRVEFGFAEFLFAYDFPFDPLSRLHYSVKGPEVMSEEIAAKMLANESLPGPVWPETYEQGTERVTSNWQRYMEKVTEDVCIVVSHLFVVETLSSAWLGHKYQIEEDGYCKLTVARYDGAFHVLTLGDYQHATQ
jgi:broad specificity phosphatase PhoE